MKPSSSTLPLLLSAAVLTAACVKDPAPAAPASADGTVRLTMSVMSPSPGTKAFGETAEISSLLVVVFDASGCYAGSAAAEDITPGAGGETAFAVTLTATSDPVTLHLVANHDPGRISFGVETEVMGRMVTSGGAEALWQRVALPGGIPADGSTPSAMTRIPLVRNFAAVSVSCTAAGFEYKGFALTNRPDRGCVAPVTGTGTGFAPYSGETAPGYDVLHASGFTGFTPAGAALEGSDGESLTFTYGTEYMYEHPYTGDPATCTSVIIRGRKEGAAKDSYYKMDIVRPSGDGPDEYYDILRNIRYALTVTNVSCDGHSTAQEAMDSPAGNNIGGSVNTDELPNISDGDGQLFVSHTELTLVSGEPVTFKYRWVPDIRNHPDAVSNGTVTVSAPAGDVLRTAAAVASSDTDGWRTVTLNPNTPSALIRTQEITVTSNTGLQKRIRLTLMRKYTMSVAVSPESVPKVIGTPVGVTVTIPAGLPESFFPLDLTVSTDGSTLYPDAAAESMPVAITTPTYGFVKSVSWSAYTAATAGRTPCTVTCRMLTNCKESATTVRVNEYHFEEASASFTNS